MALDAHRPFGKRSNFKRSFGRGIRTMNDATTATSESPMKSETRDGMRIDWDVPIRMDDGIVLRADVFRPVADGQYPVIMNHGPYAKGLSFQEGFKSAWDRMVAVHPDVPANSTNKYQNWEAVDPEK